MVKNLIHFVYAFILVIAIYVPETARGQEYKVAEFGIDVMDLTARTKPRVDVNGRKCAVLKVLACDKIVGAKGSVIGDIESLGMEKLIYVPHDTKQIQLNFENHYPLRLVFDDYGYPTVSEQMVYIVKLVESNDIIITQLNQSNHQVDTSHKIQDEVATLPEKYTEQGILQHGITLFNQGYFERAINEFRNIAHNVNAQYYLGLCYESDGNHQDFLESFDWFRRAAEQGNKDAQYKLGECFWQGKGVKKNLKNAFKWYHSSAEQENSSAQKILGHFYEYGIGIKKSKSDATYWYRKAAEQGDIDAIYLIGLCYEMGNGVQQSDDYAVYWYKKGAELGDPFCQTALAECYATGKGIKKNENDALFWYKKAAEQGHEDAINNLKRRGLW